MEDAEYSAESQSAPASRRGLGARLWSLLIGVVYLAVISLAVSGTTTYSLAYSLAMVSLAAVVAIVVCLILAARWALKEQRYRWQLRLSSLFLVTLVLALYFGAMQWLIRGAQLVPEQLNAQAWFGIGVTSVYFLVVSIPFVLHLADSLLWLAVWIIRRRAVQDWLRRLR